MTVPSTFDESVTAIGKAIDDRDVRINELEKALRSVIALAGSYGQEDGTAERLILDGARNALSAHGKHYHVAGTTVGWHIDKCAACGRDLRDPIHIRQPKE